MKLTQGMELIFKDSVDGMEEKFLVCRTGDTTLNLFSMDDWNRWISGGFHESMTIKGLNRMVDDDGVFVFGSDEKVAHVI